MADANSIVQVLRTGLEAASLRGKTIANNLANIDTPGYRRMAVDFEQRLAEALESSGGRDLEELTGEVFRPLNTPVESNGNDVSLDMEIGEMVKNSARYKTYMRVMTKVYGQMDRAMQTGS
jgi:flagellar basal-body rod protein FlgB